MFRPPVQLGKRRCFVYGTLETVCAASHVQSALDRVLGGKTLPSQSCKGLGLLVLFPPAVTGLPAGLGGSFILHQWPLCCSPILFGFHPIINNRNYFKICFVSLLTNSNILKFLQNFFFLF